MATKTVTTVICDCCGKTLDNHQGYSGRAEMILSISAGAHGGGSERKIVFGDLCLKCAFELEKVIDTFKFNKLN